MAVLNDILKNDIERKIDGVIKADDQQHIQMEVEEYVLTREVVKHLNKLISGYKESIESVKRCESYPFNGVWISGYFGSGKSHLLKMLSYILENQTIDGTPLADLFLPKIQDSLFKADFSNILKVPSESILFNIDQEAFAAPKESESALLYIFESVFNRHCGYFPTNRGVAEFEQHLDEQGQYQQFKDDYLRITGKTWEDRRKAVFGLARKELVSVLVESQKMTEEDAGKLIDHYKSGSELTIDSFATRVKDWLDAKESKDFRLNFFIDEVGQFIAGKTRLMLNLQTLAETLGTLCGSRVWIFVTSQEDLTSVVGQTDRQQTQDFSKINARYHFKIALNSADVQEVIQKRLLDKTNDGASQLGDLYMKEQETFRTLFRMDEGGRQYKFRSKEEFVLSYPFQAYQYNLLQSCLRSLSEHNAFRGQHVSQGERSMLEIFQDVSKQLKGKPLFHWATFDLMFEGLRQTLNTGLIAAINDSERNLDDHPLAVRLLKILLLVKYVRTFKATQNHLKILLIEEPGQDLVVLDRELGDALNLLEHRTYIQRNGMEYSYLTNEEKDIEEEIKRVEISHDEIRKSLRELIFGEILKLSTKIRDPELKEDYAYMVSIDNVPIGNKPTDLGIHVISPEHPQYGDKTSLYSQSMGKKEVTLILPSDRTFQQDLRLYYQTDQYCRQQQGHEQTVQIQNIISSKQQQNSDRKNQLRKKLADILSSADIRVMGNEIDIRANDPQARVLEAFQKLLKQAYPKLQFLGGKHYVENDLKDILYPREDSRLFSGDAQPLDEAEKEMLNWLRIRHGKNEIPSMKNLVDEFSTGQLGWYSNAIICILARLYMRDKVELQQGHRTKSKDEVFSFLSSNREYEQVRLAYLPDVSGQDLETLRGLYMDLFHETLKGTTAKESAIHFKQSLCEKMEKTESEIQRNSYQMNFLSQFPLDQLKDYAAHSWEWYLEHLEEIRTQWIPFFQEEWEPLSGFLTGNQKELWLELKEFADTHKDNLVEIGKVAEYHDLEALLEQIPYKNGILRTLKTSVKSLQQELESRLQEKKQESVLYIKGLQETLSSDSSFRQLAADQQKPYLSSLEELVLRVEQQDQLARIRDLAQSQGPQAIQKIHMDIHRLLNPEVEIHFASDQEKKVPFAKSMLETPDDVHAYGEALKAHFLGLIDQDKKITL